MNNAHWKNTLVIAAVFCLAIPISAISDDADVIPPEILKQMDPHILSGKRPVIHELKQTEIFGLRDKPQFDSDFVTFDFDPGTLSSVQSEIIRTWIRSGTNKLYFKEANIVRYGSLLGLQPYTDARIDGYRKPVRRRTTLPRHSVNTDCRYVSLAPFFTYGSLVGNDSYTAFTNCGQAVLKGLPPESVVVMDVDNHAAAGRFHIGDGVVYFRHKVAGADSRRWVLNWWHWAMGLPVPGAAETGTPKAPALRLADLSTHDMVELKNGDCISGEIQNPTFAIRTSYGVVSVKKAEANRILLEGAGANTDRIVLRIGDRLSGQLQEDELKLILASGASLVLPIERVASIRLATPSTQKG